MPVMPRPQGKAQKIVDRIIGKPGALRPSSEKDRALSKKVVAQRTSLLRGVVNKQG